jgi:hypothetical protein
MADRLREFVQRMSSHMPAGGGGGGVGRALGLGAVGLSGLAYASTACLFNVEGGYRAVMYHRFGGVQERVRNEGTHIVLPWFQRVVLYDVRAKPRMIQSLTGSKGAPLSRCHGIFSLLPRSRLCLPRVASCGRAPARSAVGLSVLACLPRRPTVSHPV